jgi:hypothetical protein
MNDDPQGGVIRHVHPIYPSLSCDEQLQAIDDNLDLARATLNALPLEQLELVQ